MTEYSRNFENKNKRNSPKIDLRQSSFTNSNNR